MDAKTGIEVATFTEEMWKRDFMVAAIVTLLAFHLVWIIVFRGMLKTQRQIQDARVQDQKDAVDRYDKLVEKNAVVLDRTAETIQAVLVDLKTQREAAAAAAVAAAAKAGRRRDDKPKGE